MPKKPSPPSDDPSLVDLKALCVRFVEARAASAVAKQSLSDAEEYEGKVQTEVIEMMQKHEIASTPKWEGLGSFRLGYTEYPRAGKESRADVAEVLREWGCHDNVIFPQFSASAFAKVVRDHAKEQGVDASDIAAVINKRFGGKLVIDCTTVPYVAHNKA